MSNEELHAWGWLISFAAGAAFAVFAVWLRDSMAETSSFVEHQSYSSSHANLRELLRHVKTNLRLHR